MKLAAILTLLLLSMTSCHPMHEEMMNLIETKPNKEKFKLWHLFYGKTYDLNSETALRKYRSFKDNLKYIAKRNAEQTDLVLGLGPFSDLSFEEFLAENPPIKDTVDEERYHKIAKEGKKKNKNRKVESVNDTLFDKMADEDDLNDFGRRLDDSDAWKKDWSYLVKLFDKKGCHCDGIIAGVHAIQAKWYIQHEGHDHNGNNNDHEAPVPLSVSQARDCDTTSMGCFGGFPDKPFFYALEWGLSKASDYPYTAKVEECKVNCKGDKPYVPYVSIGLWDYCLFDSSYPETVCSEEKIRGFTAKGPYASLYDHQHKDFQNYKEGLLDYKCMSPIRGTLVVQLTAQFGKFTVFGVEKFYFFKRNREGTCFFDKYAWQSGTVYPGDEPDDDDE